MKSLRQNLRPAFALIALYVCVGPLGRAQPAVTQVKVKSGANTNVTNIAHQLPAFNFNGESPVLRVISGDKQHRVGGFLPLPIVIAVYRADGLTPWPGAPVTLGVEYGSGHWTVNTAATPAANLTVNADANGRVQAYYWMP